MSEQQLATEVYAALGSNMGDRLWYLQQAVLRLNQLPGTTVSRCSSVYETEPIGYVDQPAFLNMVIAAETSLTAEALFQHMLDIEQQLERVRDVRWGPRTIDLDLLIYGNLSSDNERLMLPHPRMLERAFVLIPLLDVYQGNLQTNRAIFIEALAQLTDRDGVTLWTTNNWRREYGHFVN